MPLTSLILFAFILPVSGNAPASLSSPAVTPHQSNYSMAAEPAPQQNFQLSPAPLSAADSAASDDICYKIRAYIFKRDDDHAPEFVRSTTCGPGTPHAKSIDQPKGKLVPAN